MNHIKPITGLSIFLMGPDLSLVNRFRIGLKSILVLKF